MEAFDRRLLDGAIHPLDLPVGPRMVWLGKSVLDVTGLDRRVEAHLPRSSGISVAWLVGKLDAPFDFAQDRIVGQDRIDPVRHCFQQVFEELPRCSSVSPVEQLRDGELARAVDANEQVEPFDVAKESLVALDVW